MRLPTRPVSLLFAALTTLASGSAAAFPGFLVGKADGKRTINTGQVVIMQKGETSVVTVMADYEGPLDPFAVVLVVPGDVTEERLKMLRRDFVDRVDQLSAPRFHEWYEGDPCDSGERIQLWEMSKKAASDTAFLGGGDTGEEVRKVPKEMLLNFNIDYKKQGEYTFTFLTPEDDLAGWLGERGYKISPGAAQAVKGYVDQGSKVVVAEVNPNKIELIGGDRSILSPVQFWTETPYTKVPARLSINSLDKHQELLIYVLHPEQRYETKNYNVVFPPTNLHVDPKVEERMGEFYTALYDRLDKKYPMSFVAEYAWTSEDCGQPCPNEPLLIHEKLTLGGDIFEQSLPEEVRLPKAPDLTEEEKKKEDEEFKAKVKAKEMKQADVAKEKKQRKAERDELERRKGVLSRQKYVISRVHRRYDANGLPKDVEIGPAAQPVRGGVGVPQGKEGAAETTATPAKENMLQVRYFSFNTWGGEMKCEKPERWRWGRFWSHTRKRRKIWVADDLARRNRDYFKLDEVVWTPVPELGLKGEKPKPKLPDGGVDGGAATEEADSSSCGCRVVGGSGSTSGWIAVFLAAAAIGCRRLGRRF